MKCRKKTQRVTPLTMELGGGEINVIGAAGVKPWVVSGHQVAKDNGFRLQRESRTIGGGRAVC